MGFGNGIGIGWPMASSSRGANLGYFAIAGKCDYNVPGNWTTQLVDTSIYHTGDYVGGLDNKGNEARFLLGEIVLEPGVLIMEISGPTYTSCPIYRAFTIDQFCNGGEPYGCTSQIDITYYNTGDYIYSPDLQTRVRLGAIVPEGDLCIATIPVEGPKYNSCEVNPPFTGYFGFQEYCNGGEVEQTYYGPTTQTWQIGQVVINTDAAFENAYVIINSIVPDLGGEFYPTANLQGPALNGCPVL